MKKNMFIVLGILFVFALTGCGTGDTITDNPRNHVYGPNDVINIYDNVDTGELIGTLRVPSINVLSEGPIYISEVTSYDEDQNPVYSEVEYAQLIQVNYIYESTGVKARTIDSSNFTVRDNNDRMATNDPGIGYTMIPIEGVNSFVVATKNWTDGLNIEFKYKILQFSPTAVIRVRTADSVIGEPIYQEPKAPAPVEEPANNYVEPIETPVVDNQGFIDQIAQKDIEIQNLKNELATKDGQIQSLSAKLAEKDVELNRLKNQKTPDKTADDMKLFAIIALSFAVVILGFYIREMKQREKGEE